jgi:peptidoglycan/LPS O-acetylase OafA/YrhL
MGRGRLMWLAFWLGQAGVLAFFVYTSLVLMSSIERLAAPRDVVFVLVVRIGSEVPVAQKTQPSVAPGAIGLLSNLLLVQNLTGSSTIIRVLWSLPIEVQMYVVLPLCYVVARYRPHLLPLLFALGIAGAYLRSADIVRRLWRFDRLFYFPCCLSGVLAYAILRRQRPGRRLPSGIWPLVLPLVIGVSAIFLAPSGGTVSSSASWSRRSRTCARVRSRGRPILQTRDRADRDPAGRRLSRD